MGKAYFSALGSVDNAKMAKIESDGKQLIEEESVSVKVEDDPPPYQHHERGLRAYPTKRAYAWLCARGSQPYAQFNNDANNVNGRRAGRSDSNGRRLNGITLVLLAIPVTMLVSLGAYFMMMMVLHCPTCKHHAVTKVESRIVPPETHVAKTHLKHDIHEMKFKDLDRQATFPPRDQLDAQQPIVRRHWFVFWKPKNPDHVDDKPKAWEDAVKGEKQPETKKTKENEAKPGLSSKLMTWMMNTANNMISNIHGLFDFHPMANTTQLEDSSENHQKIHETVKVEDEGTHVNRIGDLIDQSILRKWDQLEEHQGAKDALKVEPIDEDEDTDPFSFNINF